MPEFTRDQPGPAAQFRPGPGQLGEHAALQGLKPASARRPAGARGRADQRRAQRVDHTGQHALGLSQRPEETSDQRHLTYGLAHANSQGLGRDLPFGLWAYQNGLYPELAQGQQFPDWLD